MASENSWGFWGDTDEDEAEIQSMLAWLNPYYRIQDDDRVYSLDTGENDELKKQILTASYQIRALVRTYYDDEKNHHITDAIEKVRKLRETGEI